jgi:hypothetical protein
MFFCRAATMLPSGSRASTCTPAPAVHVALHAEIHHADEGMGKPAHIPRKGNRRGIVCAS